MKQLAAIFLASILAISQAWSADTQLALQLAQDTSDKMLQALSQKREQLQQDPSQIYDLVEGIVLPHFDFETIARWVLGKHWRQASQDQQQRFTQEFRTLLVRTYAKALLEYSNEEVRFLPLNAPAEADEVTVRSEIKPKSGPSIPINYSLHARDGVWKVFDVVIEGVSLVANYRGTIGDQVRKEGIDAVIQKLSERNSQGS